MNEHKTATITVHELKKRWDADPKLCLIDVREHYEWRVMRIPGALHIPSNELVSQLEDKALRRDCPIYLHCRTGQRSLNALSCLLDQGYEEVYSIQGGILEWEMCGYPVEEMGILQEKG